LRHHFMPEFYAAILNAQPMGFYSPASLVEDAKRHGVEVRPADVSYSEWDCTLEPSGVAVLPDFPLPTSDPSLTPRWPRAHPLALRIGLRYVRGLGDAVRDRLERAINPRPRSIAEFVHRAQLEEHQLLALASAGAFDALESERRRAIWDVLRLAKGRAGPLDLPGLERDAPRLPEMTRAELVAADHARVGLSSREHPMHFLRGELDVRGVITALALRDTRRKLVKVAGIVTCRQRPGTAKGFVFITLEDEGGMINVVVEPTLFETHRQTIVGNPALEIDGVLERQDGAINVKAKTIRGLRLEGGVKVHSHDFH
ncbi:MAG: OB-fold nucleic acid binding domain-containing protein, partial [Polyangiales bacterium]